MSPPLFSLRSAAKPVSPSPGIEVAGYSSLRGQTSGWPRAGRAARTRRAQRPKGTDDQTAGFIGRISQGFRFSGMIGRLEHDRFKLNLCLIVPDRTTRPLSLRERVL